MEHTPGPWEMIGNSWAITTIYKPDRQGIVCELVIPEEVDENVLDAMQSEQAANARLIVASPELFTALSDLLIVLDQPDYHDFKARLESHKRIARAALAKAKAA